MAALERFAVELEADEVHVRLRRALGRKAADLDLPAVSVTLVPESERGLVESFGEQLVARRSCGLIALPKIQRR